jgi:hypothetical protein
VVDGAEACVSSATVGRGRCVVVDGERVVAGDGAGGALAVATTVLGAGPDEVCVVAAAGGAGSSPLGV